MNVLNILILVGALHGIIMSVLLWRQKINKVQNRLLAAIVFILGLENWGTYCFTTGLVEASIWYYYSTFSLIFALGPVLYWYTKSIKEDKFSWQKHYWLHLTPLLIKAIQYQSYFLFNPRLPLSNLYLEEVSKILNQYGTGVSVFLYLYFCRRLIQANAHNAPENPAQARYLTFLSKIYGVLFVVNFTWCLYLVCRVFNVVPIINVSFYGLHILLSLLIYWVAIDGYFIHREPVAIPKPKNKLSAQEEEQVSVQLNRIRETLEGQHVYLQPDLTLELLSQYVGIHHKTLSQLINQYFGLNFNDFINQYRIQEAQRRLVSQQYSHLTIEGIGQEVGFNSKTTFNRSFKLFTKMTAKEYIKSQLPSAHPI